MLYLIATPIGHLKDITLRALDTLREVDLVLCEDTRHTGKLLNHYKINKPLSSFHEHNEQQRIPQVVDKLNREQKIALVSDAGTPTISDPGYKLVRQCLQHKIKIEAIPGPSAILTALVVSGMPTDKFLFLGYLPRKKSQREKLFLNLGKEEHRFKQTYIAFETPYRLLKSLQDLYESSGDIDIAVCRELTKVHEEVRREKISQSIAYFENAKPRGEMTLVFRLNS